jgi:hypothetical protein
MKGIDTLFGGGVLGAKMVCFGRAGSRKDCAGYGPEPDVAWPAPLGASEVESDVGFRER